jgi:hypothetical protein
MKPNGSGKHVVVGGRFGKRHFPNKVDWGTHPSRDPPLRYGEPLSGTRY